MWIRAECGPGRSVDYLVCGSERSVDDLECGSERSVDDLVCGSERSVNKGGVWNGDSMYRHLDSCC